MRKQKYYYNSETLSYEKASSTWRWKLLKGIIYLGSVSALAILFSIVMFNFFETPQEKLVKRDLQQMEVEYSSLQERINSIEQMMNDLAERDENIYRVVFEAEPISQEVRQAGMGGGNKYIDLLNLPKGKLIRKTKLKVEQLEKKVAIQSKSYEELKELLQEKEQMLASIPAITPVEKSEKSHLSSGFGMRYHPIYKTRRMHAGLDFSAPIGTAIHASGDGKVSKVEKRRSGYGWSVVIDHSFGYKTLYAHMSEINVSKGQKVTRGQIIGAVGNTGTSTAPHLHYEVHKDGKKINPIHYFFNDLTPEEYEEIIEKAELSNHSFD